MNAGGTASLTGTVDLTLQIYNVAENCLLFEETQNSYNLDANAGVATVEVGAGTRTGNDPGRTMQQIFDNTYAHGVTANCAAGYTPASGDGRHLRVTATPSGGSAQTITQVIDSVPSAFVAETSYNTRDFADKNSAATDGTYINTYTAAGTVAIAGTWKVCALARAYINYSGAAGGGTGQCFVERTGTSGNDGTWQITLTESGGAIGASGVQCTVICMR